MKRSYLYERYLKTNGSICEYNSLCECNTDERYSGWEITEINMEEPITPSIILKRTIYET